MELEGSLPFPQQRTAALNRELDKFGHTLRFAWL
jgi:hypothetical protein